MNGAELPRRTSALAAVSFVWGLAAMTCTMTAWFLGSLFSLDGMGGVGSSPPQQLALAARILHFITIGSAIFSGIFWLAARGAVRESGGRLGGTGLYRTGVLVSMISVLVAVAEVQSSRIRFGELLQGMKEKTDYLGAWPAGADLKAREAEAAKGFLGVETTTARGGLTVKRVLPGTAAEAAGLAAGDLLLQVDGRDIQDQASFTAAMASRRAFRDVIRLNVFRGNRSEEQSILLGSRFPEWCRSPGEPAALAIDSSDALVERLGVSLQPVPALLQATKPDEVRLRIAHVFEGPLAKVGIGAGDVIVKLNGKSLGSQFELEKILSELPGTRIWITFRRENRGDFQQQVDLPAAQR